MTNEQRAKLDHAVKRSANQAYCGDREDADLLALVDRGYMRGPIAAGFLPEGSAYFQATAAGREALANET